MWSLLCGVGSFVSLVVSLMAFRRYKTVAGWIFMGLFVLLLIASLAALWSTSRY